MFSNKAFNAALFISLTWHLVCMFAVNIVVLPGKYRMRELTSVSFLGPILENTALDILLANKPVAVTTTYQRDLKYMHTVGESGIRPAGNNVKRYIGGGRAEDNMYSAFDGELGKRKEVPDIAAKAKSRRRSIKSYEGISGPVSNREVIYRPEKPALPSWAEASSPFKVELEFIVSAQGEVKKVVPVVSSGDAEVDLLGMRYLKSWRFAPLTPGLGEEQKGSVELVFGARE